MRVAQDEPFQYALDLLPYSKDESVHYALDMLPYSKDESVHHALDQLPYTEDEPFQYALDPLPYTEDEPFHCVLLLRCDTAGRVGRLQAATRVVATRPRKGEGAERGAHGGDTSDRERTLCLSRDVTHADNCVKS